MKSFVLMIAVLVFGVSSAFAFPKVGDEVVRKVKATKGHETSEYEVTLKVVKESDDGLNVLVRETSQGQVSEAWHAKAAMYSDADTEDTLKRCNKIGGHKEMIETALGRVPACRFHHEDKTQCNTVWMGKVPFGMIKLSIHNKLADTLDVSETVSVAE